MAFSPEVGNFAAATSTGSQTITLADSGLTPKWVIFFWTGRTTAGAGAMGSADSVGYGMTDGTNEVSNALGLVDGVDASAADSCVNDKCIRIIDGDGNLESEADITSFGAGQIVINWSTNNGSAYLIGYMAFGGSDLSSVATGSFVTGTGSTTSETIGFQTNSIIFGGADNNTTFPAAGRQILGIGGAIGTGATDQYAVSGRKRNNALQATYSGYDSNRCWISADDSAVPNSEYHVSTIASTSFTVTKDVGGAEQAALIYSAFAGLQVAIGTAQSPTSTGNQTISSLGFTPSAVLFFSGGHTTASGYAQEMRISIGAATSATQEICVGAWHTDSSLHDQAILTNKVIALYSDGTPTLDEDAEFTSFASGQFTINWTNVNGTDQNYWHYIAFGPAAAGTTDGALDVNSTGTVTMSGQSDVTTDVDINAAGAVTMEGRAAVETDLDVNSAAAVSWVGESTAFSNGVLDINSAATVTMEGRSQADTDVDINAASTVTMEGQAQASTDVDINATGQLDWITQSTVEADASIQSSAVVSWIGEAISAGEGKLYITTQGNAQFVGSATTAAAAEEPTTIEPGGGAKGWPSKKYYQDKKRKKQKQDEEFMELIVLAMPQILAYCQQRQDVGLTTIH